MKIHWFYWLIGITFLVLRLGEIMTKQVVLTLSLLSLLGLSACFNDTPYSSGYSHVGVLEVNGPGHLIFESELYGTQICTPEDNSCGHTTPVLAKASVIVTAIPDEGHTFVGWTGDVKGNENPLVLLADRDYFFSATFK
jgi:hypothetical protein